MSPFSLTQSVCPIHANPYRPSSCIQGLPAFSLVTQSNVEPNGLADMETSDSVTAKNWRPTVDGTQSVFNWQSATEQLS